MLQTLRSLFLGNPVFLEWSLWGGEIRSKVRFARQAAGASTPPAGKAGLTMNAFFSSTVWKRPWPNLEVVSMNLRSIFSSARRLVCTRRDCGPRRGHSSSVLRQDFLLGSPPQSQGQVGTSSCCPRPLPHLAQGKHTLLGPHHTALEHDKVVGHFTIVDKTTLGEKNTSRPWSVG